MSETCPKCGAARVPTTNGYVYYECGSDCNGETVTVLCLRRQLAAEKDACKQDQQDVIDSLRECETLHDLYDWIEMVCDGGERPVLLDVLHTYEKEASK